LIHAWPFGRKSQTWWPLSLECAEHLIDPALHPTIGVLKEQCHDITLLTLMIETFAAHRHGQGHVQTHE
jgi:hypothetical protein